MTFGEFSAAVRLSVFPDSEPENLVNPHKNYVLDAMIDLQIKVNCLQQQHVDYLCASASFYNCGASVFESPRGFIRSLSTMVPGDNCCREVKYIPVSKVDLDCMLENQKAFSFCSTSETHPADTYLEGDEYVYFPDTPIYCMDYVGPNDTTIDKASRAAQGYFTIDRGQIWVTPHIQSDELVKLDWDGVKRDFADTDILDEEIWNREVAECVELYLRGKAAGIDDCDVTRSIFYNNENMQRPGQYQVRRADLIHTCEKQLRPPKRTYCYDSTCGGGMFLGAGSSSASSDSSSSTSATEVYFGSGDPNGVQTATRPAIFYTALGAMWFKTGDGTNDTGWEKAIA